MLTHLSHIGYVGPSWSHVAAMLPYLGAMLGPWPILELCCGYVGPSWSYVDAMLIHLGLCLKGCSTQAPKRTLQRTLQWHLHPSSQGHTAAAPCSGTLHTSSQAHTAAAPCSGIVRKLEHANMKVFLYWNSSGTLQQHQHAGSKTHTCSSSYTWSKNPNSSPYLGRKGNPQRLFSVFFPVSKKLLGTPRKPALAKSPGGRLGSSTCDKCRCIRGVGRATQGEAVQVLLVCVCDSVCLQNESQV